MKNICLIFVILFMLLSGLSVIAQSAQIAWGEQFELDKKNRLYRLVGMDEVNYYVISGQVKKSEFELLTFEISDHKLVNTHPLNFKYDKTKYTFLNSIQTTAGMFLYYFENNKAANKIELFVAKIEQGKLGDFLLVHSQDKVEGLFSNHLLNSQLSIFGNGYKVKVNQQISPDKKLVTLSYRQEIKGRFDDFQLLCLNENMELEWHKKIDFSEEKKKIFIGDFQIDTDGTIYCLTRVHKHAFKEVVKDLINKSLSKDYFFRVYKINEEREYFDFVFDKNSIYDPEKVLLVLKNGKSLPALTGIYATKNKNASTKGSFYATMDNMDDPPDVKFFPFKNISLVSRNFRDNWDKLDSPKPNYNYIKSYQFENGNLALILENHVVQS